MLTFAQGVFNSVLKEQTLTVSMPLKFNYGILFVMLPSSHHYLPVASEP